MLKAGFDDYVAKPIDMHELDAALARVAARRDMKGEEKMPPAAGGLRPPDPPYGVKGEGNFLGGQRRQEKVEGRHRCSGGEGPEAPGPPWGGFRRRSRPGQAGPGPRSG
jgi:hypothetical protein